MQTLTPTVSCVKLKCSEKKRVEVAVVARRCLALTADQCRSGLAGDVAEATHAPSSSMNAAVRRNVIKKVCCRSQMA